MAVHPTKKANKWKCKICGENQSIKRFYGLGTGKECRLHVQKLNEIQGDIHNSNLKLEDTDESSNSQDEETISDSNDQNETVVKEINKKSKWTDYVDVVEENDQEVLDKNMYLNETEVVLELPKKKPRKSQHVVNTPDSSSENKYVPATKVNNNSTKDKTVESKQFNKSIVNLGHTGLTGPPAATEIRKKFDLLSNLNKSKWAQYVEETEILNNENPAINDQTDLKDAPNIFSLFDDDNLDAVLDF
ncbi:hypothetical protein MSG28_000478 [Choristoneura fumiferana]|uniref:Uncharacterized protein n=1 Tax=Choristoneura fumiferana TaxID=7141 RepID=A0ACC0K1H6_CHOFU|nr:hypothetical protein MSG28_000478 [Choristoneura fumiferana]